MRPSNLYLLVGCAVGAILLAAWITAADNGDDLKLIANTTNVIGAVVTFLGLLYAYIRASSAATAWLQRQRARIARGLARITGWALPTIGAKPAARSHSQRTLAAMSR
jgi:hypothetical protein